MYEFESTDFSLSENGIHLLRSGYNYRTIVYQDIKTATIRKCPETKNVLLSIISGLILIAFSCYQAIDIVHAFNDPTIYRISIESILLPLFPLLAGLYLVYIATKKGPVLIIESHNEKDKLRLREYVQNNKIDYLKQYLSSKLDFRLLIQWPDNR